MTTPNVPNARDAGMSVTPNMGTDASIPVIMPVAMGDCKATDAPRSCTYSVGCDGTQRCVGTSWGECEPPADRLDDPETCNGVDDNCNGMVDEMPAQPCYPPNTVGCTQNANGSFSCNGLCTAGTQQCVNGRLSADCNGPTTPTEDKCQLTGTLLDEDCDGTPDKGCNCTTERPCYTGGGTEGLGECRAGKQQCVGGMLDAVCVGQVSATVELCNGKDDDCNGMTDDVPGVGVECSVPNAKGICTAGTRKCVAGNTVPVCVAKNVAGTEICNTLDDDCNGVADDVPGLQTNASMCGGCGKPACTAAASSCCAGGCVDLQSDLKNCGMCGKSCATGETCSAGMCKAPVMGGAGASGASGSSGGAGASGMAGGAAGAGLSD
jgi:hypothetical protein